MRCGCPQCGTYMIQSEGIDFGCVCPECLYRCRACMGTNTVVSRENLRSLFPWEENGYIFLEPACDGEEVLERMEEIRRRVNQAENPILAGMQFAILGNYLDFSALQGNVSYEKLDEMLSGAKEIDVTGPSFDAFVADLERGKKLLYLTDNAGEIGFDRVFAETIRQAYPNLEITFCVRGFVTQNDATREDAAAVGLPFPVIDNGNRVAGTQIELLSPEAKQALDQADVILAKGMGNAETMLGCGYNVYYAFLVKCPRFVQIFEKPLFTPMFIHEGDAPV